MKRMITVEDTFELKTSLKGKIVTLKIDASELSDADLTERFEASFRKLMRDQFFSGRYGKLDASKTEYTMVVKPLGVRLASQPSASIDAIWARLSEEERRAFIEKVTREE